MHQLLTYTKFQTPGDAEFLIGMLKQNDIPYKITHEVNQLDNIYIGESLDPMFELKIHQSDFSKVSDLLAKQAINDYKVGNYDHYFNSFSHEDLEEIIKNPNDWNPYMLQLAKTLLHERFNQVSDQNTNVELVNSHKPEIISQSWIIAGYVLSLFTIFGIFIGLSIIQAKKTLQNGETVNIYDKATTKHGRNMIILGVITTSIVVISKLIN